jgi:hypothetical protein
MKRIGSLLGVASLFVALVGVARAQVSYHDTYLRGHAPSQPCCPPPYCPPSPYGGYPTYPTPTTPPPTTPPTTPPTVPPTAPAPELTPDTAMQEAFAAAPEAGTEAGASFNPSMFGDLIGVVGRQVVSVPNGVTLPPGFKRISGNLAILAAPLPVRSAFKISEQESPRPQNRVYATYHYYDNTDQALRGPGVPASNLHREILGFEYVLGNQRNASIGMRLPFFQLRGNDAIQDSQLGDLNVLLKYAFINDRQTGNVLSTGMVITTPTGPGLQIAGQSTINPLVLQPWLGFIYNPSPNWYLQGFSSLAVPFDARDVTLFFNSLALGYWLYRDDSPPGVSQGMVTGIVPVAEFHLNTPLTHRGLNSSNPIVFSDSLNFTGGCYIFLRGLRLGAAVGLPLTGPQPYDFEASGFCGYYW